MSFEVSLMEWLQANIPGPLILLISQFSAFGEEFALVAVMGFVYWCHDKEFGRKLGLLVYPMLFKFRIFSLEVPERGEEVGDGIY